MIVTESYRVDVQLGWALRDNAKNMPFPGDFMTFLKKVEGDENARDFKVYAKDREILQILDISIKSFIEGWYSYISSQ